MTAFDGIRDLLIKSYGHSTLREIPLHQFGETGLVTSLIRQRFATHATAKELIDSVNPVVWQSSLPDFITKLQIVSA